jgi:thymidylate synthase
MPGTSEIGVEDGEMIVASKGLHIYDYAFDLARMRTYRTSECEKSDSK